MPLFQLRVEDPCRLIQDIKVLHEDKNSVMLHINLKARGKWSTHAGTGEEWSPADQCIAQRIYIENTNEESVQLTFKPDEGKKWMIFVDAGHKWTVTVFLVRQEYYERLFDDLRSVYTSL
jgi:hypothetical protein